ncbi:MAG TPA: alpha/beta hydrolase [Deltaproteobacteria bacterium]|jgi:pimeloyl-ACP methyl ester carboxylesterase|nr:alpha/beta hydrolase [Deltaproteobacteria bacterium]
MATFERGAITIHYVVEGSGPAITLIHGFASSLRGNWRVPGIIDALSSGGRQVVALDCRGHGKSSKPHDPLSYAGTAMAEDVISLLDHLALAEVDLMGYSMGGWIAASLLTNHPERFRSVILAGVGDGILAGGPSRARSEAIASALDAKDASAASGATARAFRAFAEQQKNDLAALAALQRAARARVDPGKLGRVEKPVMILLGEGDTLLGGADKLAAAIPGARYVKVPGDHLSAVMAPEFRRAVEAFLAEHSPVSGAREHP